MAPIIITRTKDRRKRTYNKKYNDVRPQPRTPRQSLDTDTEENIIPAESSTDLIHTLSTKYQKDIWRFACIPCQVCDFLAYDDKDHRRNLKITNEIRAAFHKVDREYQLPDTLVVCMRCYNNLARNKVPPKAKINLLELPPLPKQIADLSPAEARLIAQVKAYMKVYLLCNGRGQKAMKGLVIHFPQQVDEVITQLPLSPSNADLIVVNEKGDRVEHVTTLKVRPKYIYDALCWLVANNPLYFNISINNNVEFNDFPSVTLEAT